MPIVYSEYLCCMLYTAIVLLVFVSSVWTLDDKCVCECVYVLLCVLLLYLSLEELVNMCQGHLNVLPTSMCRVGLLKSLTYENGVGLHTH